MSVNIYVDRVGLPLLWVWRWLSGFCGQTHDQQEAIHDLTTEPAWSVASVIAVGTSFKH